MKRKRRARLTISGDERSLAVLARMCVSMRGAGTDINATLLGSPYDPEEFSAWFSRNPHRHLLEASAVGRAVLRERDRKHPVPLSAGAKRALRTTWMGRQALAGRGLK